MADRQELYTALRNADAAGDTAAAQRLASYIQSLPAAEAPPAPAKPFGKQLNDAIADVPRQVGLTARYGLEGVGGMFDALVGNPVRTLAAPIFGNEPTADTGGAIADLARLPKPATENERVIGDAARMVAGGVVPIAAGARVAQGASGVTKSVAKALAANPAQQLTSAGAAGAAGGYTRETGGNDGAQFAASLAAGVATPFAANKVAGLAKRLNSRIAPADPQQINITINNALQQSGLTLEKLPTQVAQSIRDDVAKAFKTSDQVSPDAVRRLADYRMTGLTPTAAGLTLDPAIVTRQKNLAKLGINSRDPVGQQLGQTENLNNRMLTSGLNNLGAGTADDAYAGGQRIIGALERRDERANDIIGRLYDRARDSAGRSAALDPHAFTQRAGNLLHEANVESFLTPDIRNKLNGFADDSIPLTVEIAEQFKTSIGRLQRSSTDGNVRYALGAVRQALDETPLIGAAPAAVGGNQLTVPSGQPAQGLGQEAIDAFNKARRVNRTYMGIVENTPALQAVRDGVEPDKFVQQFIVGGGKDASFSAVAQLKHSIKANPVAMQSVREQIAAHLKSRALSSAEDEVGRFSQAGYNKALNAIGERKLRLFFSQPEIDQMKALGRVASYEQFQPVGSAVNNSNTAGAAGALLERVFSQSVLSKIPFGQAAIGDPLQNISVGLKAGRALDAPRALVAPQLARPRQPVGMLASPAILMAEDEDEKKRGLLFPR
jgi:hypothetical protein